MLVDLGETLLVGGVLPGDIRDCLLLLRPPEDHCVLDLERPLVGVLRGLQALDDRIGMDFVLRVQLGNVGLQLAIHIHLEAIHIELDELPRGILQFLQFGHNLRVVPHVLGDPRCEPALVWHDLGVSRR